MTADLVARIEQATEGSRELDADIWRAAEPEKAAAAVNCLLDEANRRELQRQLAPAFSTSVDTALLLVPEGWTYVLHAMWFGSATPTPKLRCSVTVCSPDALYETVPAQGGSERHLARGRQGAAIQCATPALSLCAATLRARAPTGETP